MSPQPAWPTGKHLWTHFVQFSSVQHVVCTTQHQHGRFSHWPTPCRAFRVPPDTPIT